MIRMREKFGTSAGRANLVLVSLGVALLVFYRVALALQGTENIGRFILLASVQGVLFSFAAWHVCHATPGRSTLAIIIVFAALFRLSLIFVAPNLSSDIYRYIWDGRVQAAGINPYRYIPADERLAFLRDDTIYPRINRGDYAPTIYPPVAQAIYLVVTRVSESVTWMKTAMVLFEMVTVLATILLLGSLSLPPERVLIYAWHPLVVWEIAGNGHIDAAAIVFVALALLAHRHRMEGLTGVTLALATLVKLLPVVLFPALYRRWTWRMPIAFVVTVVLAYLPYLSVGTGVLGFSPQYVEEEGLVDGWRFFILDLARRVLGFELPTLAFGVFAGFAWFTIAAWMSWSQRGDEMSYIRTALVLAASLTLLLSPRYAWYYAWLVPFLPYALIAPLVYVTASSFLLYATWIDDQPAFVFSLNALLFAPLVFFGMVRLWKHRAKA